MPRRKLTDEDIREIRRLWFAGESDKAIAERYPQVSLLTITRTITGECNFHVPGWASPKQRRDRRSNSK